jgi:NAD(P)H-hydrate epimerase
VSLPAWLEPLPDAAQQRAIDRWAIDERGIPGLELMERAGEALADRTAALAPTGRVVVVCGKGNNGGDGLVAARHLRQLGREVDVLLLADPGELQGEGAASLERLPGDPPRPFDGAALSGASAILDAILGTGSSGAPREPAAGAIATINQHAERSVIIACDGPSGVDASTGEVPGEAIRAAATVTFHAASPGLWIAPGKDHAGAVTVMDIGIPAGAPAAAEVATGLIGEAILECIPRRGRESTKFAAGSVNICGGSRGLTGAPCLAAEAAMRAGAGYVTACVPASLNLVFETRLFEVMTVALPDEDGALVPAAAAEVLERLRRADALVLGPGLGHSEETIELARTVAREAPVPLLLDADGLNAHAGRLEDLRRREAATVLTPHAGELARLLGCETSAVAAHRLACAREAAAQAQAVVVLKGDDTLVADPGGRVAVSRGGAAALATAGTGDVLSGVCGALLAKHLEPFTAACAAVFVHARAGRQAAADIGSEGVIASDVVARLPGAISIG